MASRSLNSRPDYVAKLPRTDHDLSCDFAFTSTTGHLLPVFQQFMNVGETLYVTPSMFSRTQPLLNAAMADVDIYIDSFFVPMQMLFTAWDSVRWQTNDPISSVWRNVFADKVDFPRFSLFRSAFPNDVTSSIPNYTHQTYINNSQSALGVDNFDSLQFPGEEFDLHSKELLRLFNHLHLPLGTVFGEYTAVGHSSYFPRYDVSAFYPYLLAYNCIYQNHYRLDDWERKNVNSYNIDAAFIDSSLGANEGVPFSCQLYHRPWHMDYFTSVKNGVVSSFINMIGGVNSSDSLDLLKSVDNYLSPAIPSVLSYQTGQVISSSFNDISDVSSKSPYNGTNLNNVSESFRTALGVSALRTSFALDKLLRVFGRTAKDYDSQVLAHFGFKVPHDVKHQISYLGTSKSILHIGEVVSTSDTVSADGGASLGSIAGKGYINLSGKRIKFTAPVDGVFMMIYSAVPRRLYDSYVDKVNLMSNITDLYIPEYDKLGMQPIYKYERRDLYFNSGTIAERLGWQYRYEQYKRKPNMATIAFRNPDPSRIRSVNMFSSWFVTSKDSLNDSTPTLAGYHYCPPTALNNLMVVPYITSWTDDYLDKPWLIYQSDPFINDLHVEAKLISTMSRFGEPELD